MARFFGAASFNGSLSDWVPISGEDFSGMFNGASNFSGDGLSNWDMSNATDSWADPSSERKHHGNILFLLVRNGGDF